MGAFSDNILANGEWLTRERMLRIAAICLAAYVAAIALLFATSHGTLDAFGRPIGTDFSDIYAAGRMVLDGRAPEVWNWTQHYRVQEAVHNRIGVDFYGWHYPPPFLLIAAPLALFPYVAALIGWQVTTLAAFVALMWRLLPTRETIVVTLAAPVVLICLTQGQNGFLTALLLGGGLAMLDKRPFAAGLVLGLLIYKPQFAILLPAMVLALRSWRAIAGAAVSSILTVALTIALWGWPVWQAFLSSLPLTRHVVIEQGAAGFFKIMSPFGAARMWGSSIVAAYVLQGLFTLLSIVAVVWICRSRRDPRLRNALVCAAALLTTPYVMDYDFVLLLPALAFLFLDAEQHGWLSWDKSSMFLAWALPGAARGIALYLAIPAGMLAAVAVVWVAVRRAAVRASPCRR